MMGLLAVLVSGWLVSRLGMKVACAVFVHMNWTAPNYEGRHIPLGYGLIIAVALLGFVMASVWFTHEMERVWICGAAVGVSLAGWLDDRSKETGMKGIRGHFGTLWHEGKMTTGVMKFGVIVGCAIGVSGFTSATAGSFAVNTLLIALSANFINLLDMRPGRALKGFWLLQGMCVVVGWIPSSLVPLFLYVLGCTLSVASFDFSARAMLGDAGANLLGFLAGVFCVYSLEVPIKWLLVVSLFAIHLYAEKVSLTAVIERSSLLRRIDRWGRPREMR